MSHKESEEALQKRLDEVSRELCRSQTSHASLRADAEKAQEQQQQMAGEGGGSAPRLPWGLCPGTLHLPLRKSGGRDCILSGEGLDKGAEPTKDGCGGGAWGVGHLEPWLWVS